MLPRPGAFGGSVILLWRGEGAGAATETLSNLNFVLNRKRRDLDTRSYGGTQHVCSCPFIQGCLPWLPAAVLARAVSYRHSRVIMQGTDVHPALLGKM